MKNTTINLARALIAVGVAALLVLGSTSTASAERRDKPTTVSMSGSGPWVANDGGDIVVAGPADVLDWHNGDHLPATLTATMHPEGGTLPEPGTCKPASASFVVDGDRFADTTMVGTGTLCAVVVPVAPWIVIQEFQGIYEITEAGRRNLLGEDGSFSMSLLQIGWGTAHATSVIPGA
jgi:hypothetical protein